MAEDPQQSNYSQNYNMTQNPDLKKPEPLCTDPKEAEALCLVPDSDSLGQLNLYSLMQVREEYKHIQEKINEKKEDSRREDATKYVGALGATLEAEKELLDTLGNLEEEYISILEIVKAYKEEYDKTYRQQKCKSEQDKQELENLFNGEDKITNKMKCYIKDELHPILYNSETLINDIETARQLKGQNHWNCLEYSFDVREEKKVDLDKLKIYKDLVKVWFDDLDKNLYKKIIELDKQEEYQSAYALKVEFDRVFDKKIKDLKNAGILKEDVINAWQKWICTAYNYFYFNNKNLKIQAKNTNAKNKYEEYVKEETKGLRDKLIKNSRYLTPGDILDSSTSA